MQTKEQISQVYQRFSSAEGNDHIASEYAVYKLQELVTRFEIKNVLEVGLGIGCIAGSLLKLDPHLNYTGTEANEFCLQALPQNLEYEYKHLKIFKGLECLPEEQEFDLVIIDGRDPDLRRIKKLVSKNAIIVIEGDRSPQQDILMKIFPEYKYVHSISRKKNKRYSPFPKEHWQGGMKIIFVNPVFRQKLYWGKEKIFTKFKYWLRS